MGVQAAQFVLGITDPDTFARQLGEGQAELAKYPKPAEQIALEKSREEDGFWGLFEHPAGIPSMLGELASSAVTTIPFAIAGGAAGSAVPGVGTILGGAAGIGLAAGADSFGRSFNQYLQQAGVDFNDPVARRLALDNKDLINEAFWFAAKQAGVEGGMSALGGMLGGKVALRFWTPESSLLSKAGAKGAAAATGISAAEEGLTTIGQQAVAGEPVDPSIAMFDAFLGGLTNVVPMAVPAIMERNKSKVPPAKEPGRQIGANDAAEPEIDPAAPPVNENPEPFSMVDPMSLPAIQARVIAEGPERATPTEWNNFFNKKKPSKGLMAEETPGDAPEILPLKTFATDEPLSKAEVVRTIEERQLVVEEGEPVVTEPAGDAEPQNYKSTLTLSKTTPQQIQPDPLSPVVSSTRGVNTVLANLATETTRDSQMRRVLSVEKIEGVADGPLTTPLEEIIVQRVMRWAQQEGYDFVVWPQRESVSAQTGGPVKLAVMKDVPPDAEVPLREIFSDFYAGRVKETPAVRNVADMVQASRVRVKVGSGARPKVAMDAISTRAFAESPERANLKSRPIPVKRGVTGDVHSSVWANVMSTPSLRPLVTATELGIKVIRQLETQFKLSKPLHIDVVKGQSSFFGDYIDLGTHHQIRIHLDNHKTAESIYTTLLHEFGHAVAMDKWGTTEHSLQATIMEAWEREILKPANAEVRVNPMTGQKEVVSKTGNNADFKGTMGEHVLRRRNFVKIMQLGLPESDITPLWAYANADPGHLQYELSFAEFFAENVAKWGISEVAPMGLVEKFFSSLYHRLNAIFKAFRAKFPTAPRAEAEPEIAAWLNSFITDVGPQFSVGWYTQMAKSVRSNLLALRRAGQPTGGGAVPQTPATAFARAAFAKLWGHGGVPANVAAAAAHADRFSWYAKWMESLPQVAKRNPWIRGLQLYAELNKKLHNERISNLAPANQTDKLWRGIGRKQNAALTALIVDYAEMNFRTPMEVNKGVQRQPTIQELQALMAKHDVKAPAQAVFGMIVKDFSRYLDNYENVLNEAAMKNPDPLVAAKNLNEIKTKIQRMREVPYFPFMRFGNFTLTIRDNGGAVAHFETFETKRQLEMAMKQVPNLYPPQVFTATMGKLEEDVKPLLGMPPALLDMMNEKMNLSKNQKDMLEQLKFELAPAQSFRHRFQMKNRISGYSEDFMRAYASYMFHGSSFLARAKYIDALEASIASVRAEGDFMPDGVKRHEIANYMSEHLQNTVLDARSDWSYIRSGIFHFALGFNPAQAALNFSQTPVITLPFLADKFGDLKAMGSLAKNLTQLKTYYTTTALENRPEWQFKLMGRAIKDGTLIESQAAMLAATSEGRNLIPFMARSTAEKSWYYVSQASSWMFQTAEKGNRRIAWRSALDLAYEDPGNKYVLQVVQENAMLYQEMRNEGWGHREASAYIAAKDAVEQTQFTYAGYARPRLLRGKLGTVLVFKSFMLNTLFTLWNNPGTALRTIPILMFLGGMMGIPGAEDAVDIAKVLAWQLFGKDFNLEKEARQFVLDHVDIIGPNAAIYGAGRYGFGIPALLDSMGQLTGIGDVPFPTVDRSTNIGLGPLSPIELSAIFGPVSDPDKAIADTVQRASGAAFSVGFNMYRALVDPHLPVNDWRRWYRAMPRALANATHAFDVYSTGIDRTARGTPIQNYDPTDTEQMMEIIAMGIGYNTLASSAQWGVIQAAAEAKSLWLMQREAVLMQLGHAYTIGDDEQRKSVMDAVFKFNMDLPPALAAYRLTAKGIRESLKTRIKNFELLERDMPLSRKDVPLIADLTPLYPTEIVGTRKVR